VGPFAGLISDVGVARLQGDAGATTLPSLSVSDAAVQEGNGGSSNLLFTVTLSATVAHPVSAAVSTVGGTATAGGDFTSASSHVLFLPGVTTQTVVVPVLGDSVDEVNETVVVALSDASGATIADAEGVGTILDDDLALAITQPAASPSVATQSFVRLAGTAADLIGVRNVMWANSAGGGGAATGTTAWNASVPVSAGDNVITVTARDANGFTSTATVTVNVSSLVYFLAEGATGTFFDYDLVIANPNTVPAPIILTFLRDDGVTISESRTVPATSRTTIRVDDISGLESTAVSTVVTSTAALPLVVERSVYWDSTYYGGHTGSAVEQPGTNWLFAEGSQGFFDTYLLLANANATPVDVTVRFLLESGAPIVRNYTLVPTSRFNVHAGAIPELADRSFSIVVESSLLIVAERAMYFGSPLFSGGHESAGVQAPSRTWFLAEGATGAFFDTYVLIGNPNAGTAVVTATFLRDDGRTVTREYAIPGNTRLTLDVEAQDPLLADTAVSTTISADQPVVVERAMYWPGPSTSWLDAHGSFGVPEAATRWGLAEGRSGGPFAFHTYILLANPGNTAAAEVQITFLRTDGTTLVRHYHVAPTSRFNVDVDSFVPELAGQLYSAVITVTNGVPITVERATYNNAGGVVWAAGTSATGVRLP
jgi:hypothetical protein